MTWQTNCILICVSISNSSFVKSKRWLSVLYPFGFWLSIKNALIKYCSFIFSFITWQTNLTKHKFWKERQFSVILGIWVQCVIVVCRQHVWACVVKQLISTLFGNLSEQKISFKKISLLDSYLWFRQLTYIYDSLELLFINFIWLTGRPSTTRSYHIQEHSTVNYRTLYLPILDDTFLKNINFHLEHAWL